MNKLLSFEQYGQMPQQIFSVRLIYTICGNPSYNFFYFFLGSWFQIYNGCIYENLHVLFLENITAATWLLCVVLWHILWKHLTTSPTKLNNWYWIDTQSWKAQWSVGELRVLVEEIKSRKYYIKVKTFMFLIYQII